MASIVCFGEMLLRLGAPGSEPLLRAATLETGFGGAEANVACALAGLGLDSSMVTVLPDNALGDACLGELRRCGVGTSGVIRQPGRMGLYFLTRGATVRPAQVLYDRAHSAFSTADPRLFDWPALLNGAAWIHVSGITPALSSAAGRAVVEALETARRLGVGISFDCNFRPSLWQGRQHDAVRMLRDLASRATLLFAGTHDADLLFDAGCANSATIEGLERAATAAFAACPNLELIATTDRVVHGPDHHDLTGYLVDHNGIAMSRTVRLQPIVDRIGAGDAYAAGILYGLSQGFDRAQTAEFAITLAALKHGWPGDFIVMPADDVAGAIESGARDVRR
jgi:2-dehydro-3-deoxygluconokinase